MLNHKYITIPKYYIEKYNLPTNTALSAHFTELSDLQKNASLHLAPKLLPEYLDRSKHFLKMRIKSSCHVMSHAVYTFLQFLATEKSKPEYLTTSWLVKQICKWFDIVSTWNSILALSRHNLDKYNETINFLREFINLTRQLNFGVTGDWKLFQKGTILTTQSLIDVTGYLLTEKHYDYILGGRFTQDCIENLFSVLRSKFCVLNALQFKNNLKLTAISQYMRNVFTSNYNCDDREFLPDFLTTIKQLKKIGQNR